MKIKVKQKDEHSMFSNMMFFMSLLFKASPLLVIGELIWGVMNNLPSTLISVLGRKIKIVPSIITRQSGSIVKRIDDTVKSETTFAKYRLTKPKRF